MRRMQRAVYSLGFIVLFALGACASPSAPPTGAAGGGSAAPAPNPQLVATGAPPLETVRLGMLNSASDSGLWIAVARKYFEQEGISPDVTNFASAAEMVAPLGAGQLDVGGGAPGVGLNNAALRGIDIKIVADKATTTPNHGYQGIVVRKDLSDSGQVKGPADLKGHSFAIPSDTGITPEVELNAYMKKAGLTARDAQLVPMAFPDMVVALRNKAVDSAVLIEPFLTTAIESGDAVMMERADMTYPNHQVAVILYSSQFAQKRELAVRFMTAYLRGVRDYGDAIDKKDPTKRTEIIDILTQYTPLKDKALYDKVVMPGLDPNGRLNVDSLKADQDYFIAAKLQERPADIDKMVDLSFAEAAVQKLGPYR